MAGPGIGATGAPRERAEAVGGARRLALLSACVALGSACAVGYAAVRIRERGEIDERRPADAIVVLGARHTEWTPSAVLAARLDHAVDLYRAGLARLLVVTGGRATGERLTEADVARAYLARRGVPQEAILAEEESRDTLASIRGVAALFRAHRLRSGLFVSDKLHMLRVLRMARDQGLEAFGSPTTASPADAGPERRARALVHELGGLARYLVARV